MLLRQNLLHKIVLEYRGNKKGNDFVTVGIYQSFIGLQSTFGFGIINPPDIADMCIYGSNQVRLCEIWFYILFYIAIPLRTSAVSLFHTIVYILYLSLIR